MNIKEINKVVKSLTNLNISNCPNCGSTKIKLFENTIWLGVQISYKICSYCSLVFQSPQMDADNAKLFYEKIYRLYNQGNEKPHDDEIKIQQDRAKFFSSRLQPYIDLFEKINCLDIGCSTGILLETLKTNHRQIVSVFGVEPGDAYRQHANSIGVKAFESIESIRTNIDKKFEIVTISHVLEHIGNPVEFLCYIKEHIIADNGYVMIEVPNFYGAHAYEFSHNICFTSKTLSDTIALAGFKLEDKMIHKSTICTVRPMYLNFIIKPGSPIRKVSYFPSTWVKIYRKYAPTHDSKLSTKILKRIKNYIN